MTVDLKPKPNPEHQPSSVWTIAVPPEIAHRIGCSLVHVVATQMGEVIVTLIDTKGGVGAFVYAPDEALKLAEAKAVCDRFSPHLWGMVVEWRIRWARAPWSYIGANKPRSALRDRYWHGTDPGALLRPPGPGTFDLSDEVIAKLEEQIAAVVVPEPAFWTEVDGVRVANFDRALRDDIAAFVAANPEVPVVRWSRYTQADALSFDRAKARALGLPLPPLAKPADA